MKKAINRIAKYSVAIIMLVAIFVCVWGVPLKEANISVKAHGTSVSGTFTGTWNPVKGRDGIFTADENWIFEGIINPDGGLWKGELTNFPIPAEWRAKSFTDLPKLYTGTVEENILIDIDEEVQS